MGVDVMIGELRSSADYGKFFNFSDSVFKNGAPGNYGGEHFTVNSIYLSSSSAVHLLTAIVPEFLRFCGPDDWGSSVIKIDAEVIGILSTKLFSYKSRINHPPCVGHPDVNVHWAGVLNWMLWWSTYSLKKCSCPAIVIS